MKKSVSFGAKPDTQTKPTSGEEWVKSRKTEGEPMKRLTIDVPDSLHRQIKSKCALRNVKMADAIRALLEEHFQDS